MLESFLIKLQAGIRPTTLLKKKTLISVFPYEFCKIFKKTYFVERWLLLTLLILLTINH